MEDPLPSPATGQIILVKGFFDLLDSFLEIGEQLDWYANALLGRKGLLASGPDKGAKINQVASLVLAKAYLNLLDRVLSKLAYDSVHRQLPRSMPAVSAT